MKRDDKRTIIIVLIVCLICGTIIFFFSRKSNYEKLSLVNDYGTYFSVTDVVDKYIGYLSSDNSDIVLNLLYDKYIVDNNITADNIMNYLNNYSDISSFSAGNIYSVDIGKNRLYYVTGKIVEIGYEDTTVVNDNFKILILYNLLNNSYALYPVNDDNYKNIINGIRRIAIDSNSVNKMVINDNFSDIQVCKIYFSDFISKLFNNSRDAYDVISDNMKDNFNSYEEFNNYINDNLSNFSFSSKLCNKKDYDDSRVYTVIDQNDNVYYFDEKGVMNYTVRFYINSNVE